MLIKSNISFSLLLVGALSMWVDLSSLITAPFFVHQHEHHDFSCRIHSPQLYPTVASFASILS